MMYPSLPRALGLAAVVLTLQFNIAKAQNCPNGTPYLKQTYSTYRVGNANNTYTLSQFDPNLGSLFSVKLTSVLYFTYAYRLTNTGTGPEFYKVFVYRDDSVYVHTPSNPTPVALAEDMGNTSYSKQYQYNPYIIPATGVPLGVTDTVQKVMYPRQLTTTFNKSVVPFLGADSLYITYKTVTESQAGGPISGSNVAISNQIAKDSIIFKVDYFYCPASTLASTLLTLTSRPQDQNVVLSWTTQDRYTDGYYEILKSTDGRTYTSITKVPINKSQLTGYNYLYSPLASDGTTGFFRVKQTSKDGQSIYSRVITVGLPQSEGSLSPVPTAMNKLTIFPTVTSNFINVALPESRSTDEWQISIISLSGQVLQNTQFTGNGQVKVAFSGTLPAGMHIVNALNKRTNTNYKGKMIVQN